MEHHHACKEKQFLSKAEISLVDMISVRPRGRETMVALKPGGGVGIAKQAPPKPATVTPTSTPPIQFSQTLPRRGEGIPSPITTETQKRYYEDSTWRMYDRIQASRPSKLSTHGPASSMASFPRFPPTHMTPVPAPTTDDDYAGAGQDEDEELIFDLEL